MFRAFYYIQGYVIFEFNPAQESLVAKQKLKLLPNRKFVWNRELQQPMSLIEK
jgi:hypothetical protein